MSATIIKTDPTVALKAYVAEKSPKERGKIYAEDIDPLLCSGGRVQFERLGMEFVNTLGTLSSDLITQRALSLLFARRPMLQGIITDLKAESARLNQTVFVRKLGLPTVGNFGDPPSDRADVDVQITLDKFRQSAYSYANTDIQSTNRNLVEEGADPNGAKFSSLFFWGCFSSNDCDAQSP